MSGLRVEQVQRSRKPGAVLRIADARTGRRVDVEPGYRRPLRVCVHRPHTVDEGSAVHLRSLLVADVLARTAELYGGQALVAVTEPELPENRRDDVGRYAAELGIRPPAAHARPAGIRSALGGPVDVQVTGHAAALADPEGIRLEVGAVRPRDVPGGADPLAVRLALLSRFPHEPAELTPDALDEARRTLVRWRRAMADWAQAPSKPMCADALGAALTALEEDLGVPTVLAALARVERDDALPDGSRFETFAHLDRVLGLELSREIGRDADEAGT